MIRRRGKGWAKKAHIKEKRIFKNDYLLCSRVALIIRYLRLLLPLRENIHLFYPNERKKTVQLTFLVEFLITMPS